MVKWISLLGCLTVFVLADVSAASVLPNFDGQLSKRFKTDVRRADRLGMRPRVFAKVGDSNTAALLALYGLGCREPKLAGRHRLKRVIARYRAPVAAGGMLAGAPDGCGPGNSFTRHSAATRSGSTTEVFLTPVSAIRSDPVWSDWFYPDTRCNGMETMLACEVRLIRPRFTLIALGTNDLASRLPLEDADRRFSGSVRDARRQGTVPVLLTVPPLLDGWRFSREMSRIIVTVGDRLRVPVLNVWQAFTARRMVNHGLKSDGVHIETFGGTKDAGALARSVDFRRPALRYGNNLRNLLVLRLLAVLDAHA